MTKIWQTTKQLLSQKRRLSSRFEQQSRPLTKGEKALARSVFGHSLDVDKVQLKTAWWVLKNYAVSPNGYIYFHPENWITDFSAASIGKQSWLIHELTHVWQLQQGLKVVRGAIINRRYRYHLKQGKSFFSYGIEQQAQMVQDYFIRRQRGQDCQAWADCIPFLDTNLGIIAADNNKNTVSSDSSLNI